MAKLTRSHYVWLTAGYLVFYVHGSLVPYSFQPKPWQKALEHFQKNFSFHRLESYSDFLANILLMVPMSFLILAALGADRPRRLNHRAAPFVVGLCVLVATTIEFIQIYFPPRNCDINDVFAQSLGAVVGVGSWVLLGQRFTDWFRGIAQKYWAQGLVGWIMPAYLVALILVHLQPFDLTLSPYQLYQKWRGGKIRLAPLLAAPKNIFDIMDNYGGDCVLLLPLGVMAAQLSASLRPRAWSRLRVFALGLLTAACMEALHLPVQGRSFVACQILGGALAVWIGWKVGLLFRRERPKSSSDDPVYF